MRHLSIRLITLLCVFPLSGLALAHPGGTPDTGSLISGVVHPLAGLDHVLTMLAVGLWAGASARPHVVLPILTFPFFMVLGAALAGPVLPYGETGIAVSLLVMGLLVATVVRAPTWFGVALIATFAVLHGAAHGAAMRSAEIPLAFALGFSLVTLGLHVTGIRLARAIRETGKLWSLRGFGVLTGSAGVWLLLGA